jgi:hypothetical protein
MRKYYDYNSIFPTIIKIPTKVVDEKNQSKKKYKIYDSDLMNVKNVSFIQLFTIDQRVVSNIYETNIVTWLGWCIVTAFTDNIIISKQITNKP